MPSALAMPEPRTHRRMRRLVTGDELLRHPEWGTCELINGEVIMLSPAGYIHGDTAMELGYIIKHFVQRKKLGKVYAAETGFYLRSDPDTIRAPDVMFIARDRVPKTATRGYLRVVPDLAVEVHDPEDTIASVDKAFSFLKAGVKLVWLVDPIGRQVMVLGPGKSQEMLRADGVLVGGKVLPGFKLPLKKLWKSVNAPERPTFNEYGELIVPKKKK